MSADDLATWRKAVKAFDDNELEKSLSIFQDITNQWSYVTYNTGVVLFLLNRFEEAIQKLTETIAKDAHLAIAFYRRGYINYVQKRFLDAVMDFENCERLFRRKHIDYTQIGLASKLFLSDVMYNGGLCYYMAGNITKGVELLLKAQKDPERRNGSVIDQTLSALESSQEDFSASLIPLSDITPLFRPTKNSPEGSNDFLGKAKIIAASASESDKTSNNVEDVKRSCSPESDIEEIPPPPAIPPPRKHFQQQGVGGMLESEVPNHPSAPEFPPPRFEPLLGPETQ